MYKGQTVAVVVAAYCEEGFVGDVMRTIPAFVDRIYAVDDASSDDTWAEIRQAADELNRAASNQTGMPNGGVTGQRVVPIRHEDNRGYGGAVKSGYRYAYADGIDIVAVMDGDGQMDPAILDRIIDPVATGVAAYAKGNRLSNPADRSDMSRFRLVGNGLLSWMTKLVSGYWGITDSQNGYTAISRDAIGTLDLEAVCDRYGFLNQLLARCNANDLRVTNVRMSAVYGEETSSIRYQTFVPRMLTLLLTTFWWRLQSKYLGDDHHPLVWWYLLGSVGIAGGALGLLGSTIRLLAADNGLSSLSVSSLAFLVGAISFGIGIRFDRAETAALEVSPEDRDANAPELECVE